MKDTKELEVVALRFAGDSGDGMQLVGDRFATISAVMGNEVMTNPDFPAEIRAPVGTIQGVSGYQINMGAHDVYTSGDFIDILMAMNPAAVKACMPYLRKGSTIIADADSFTDRNLKKAEFEGNPLEDGTLKDYEVYPVPMLSNLNKALEGSPLSPKAQKRCKNFYALGLSCWYLSRPIESTFDWLEKKFKGKDDIIDANKRAVKAGYEYGEASDQFKSRFAIAGGASDFKPGYYRFVQGNSAVALGLMAAADRSGKELYLGSYPITPASEILHELVNHKEFPQKVLQAEDEIAAIGAAIGASFAGSLAATTTSGPGLALKSEFVGLAVIAELPLVIVNVQRGGPSTGLPTKSEQADLYQALFGRNGESPVVVVAAKSPADCFYISIEAARFAIKYMTPVIVLTEGFMALGAEAMRIPTEEDIPAFEFPPDPPQGEKFMPYLRDKKTLARPWVPVGTPGMTHRIGGLEKQDVTGQISIDPLNHEKMCELRRDKVLKVADEYPPQEVFGDKNAKLLVVGWGSTYGAIRQAVYNLNKKGVSVAGTHLRYLYPLPNDLGDLMAKYDKVLVPENNLGQLNMILKAEYKVDTVTYHKVQGIPLTIDELEKKIQDTLGA